MRWWRAHVISASTWDNGEHVVISAKSTCDRGEQVWDAIPAAAKYQIIGFIGLAEMWSESSNVTDRIT